MKDTLAGLRPGESAVVKRVPSESAKSLTRLGLAPGTEIACIRRLPLEDPTVYRWRGVSVALRRADAARIRIETEGKKMEEKS